MENDVWLDLDKIIEDQLGLQVKISYDRHHQFLINNGLGNSKRVLDLGTGNGEFLRRLAIDHPESQFVGIDKRQHFIDRCNTFPLANVKYELVDIQNEEETFDYSEFDAVLMKYFLLHVSDAEEILKRLQKKLKKGAHFWVVDVDLSHFQCMPENRSFEKLVQLVHEFCSKNSIDTFAGQKLGPLFQKLGFKNIVRLADPFSTNNTSIEDMVRFMRQETICYSKMIGRSENYIDTAEILNFIDSKVRSREVQVDYGMILWGAVI